MIVTKLKKARERKKLSQEELAIMLSTTQKTISNWESDKSYPALEYLSKIETILEVDVLSWLAEKGIVFHQQNEKGDNAALINKDFSDELKEQYEKRLEEKDKFIDKLQEEIVFLRKFIDK